LIRDLVPDHHTVFLGGLMGSHQDCYRPDLAPDEDTAERYHIWQAAKLAEAGVDFLLAATLPSVMEAKGLARALQKIQIPYLISFVIDPQGRLLDGTQLAMAMEIIDHATDRRPPLGYMVNCAYPSFLDMAALPRGARERLWGYQANASSKPVEELDGSPKREMDDIDDWARRMATLHRQWGLKILGGCCGTDHEHLRHMISEIRDPARLP
jgi:S-methylmethionine-dependent homocysteine/selenocysteine methylase